MLEQKTTTNEELEALCAALLPKFNEYLMRHSKNIFSCELATSLDGIKTMPALYDLDGVQKQVIAPLSLLTKDVDIEIEESKRQRLQQMQPQEKPTMQQPASQKPQPTSRQSARRWRKRSTQARPKRKQRRKRPRTPWPARPPSRRTRPLGRQQNKLANRKRLQGRQQRQHATATRQFERAKRLRE